MKKHCDRDASRLISIVGESLVCSTTRVFGEIGFLDTLESGGFVKKHGAVFTLDGGRCELVRKGYQVWVRKTA